MNKELCFIIENQNLYLEQILVDYMNIPIFFLCKGDGKYYLVLRTDIDELCYIVTPLSLVDTYNLLHGKTPMRNVILKQKTYWMVNSGDEINKDIVVSMNIDTIDESCLPEENACFEMLTKQMENYVSKFDKEFYDKDCFVERAHVCKRYSEGYGFSAASVKGYLP